MMGVCKSRKVNSPSHVVIVGAVSTTAIGLDVGVSSATTSIEIGLDVGVSVVRGKHAAFSPTGASSQHSET